MAIQLHTATALPILAGSTQYTGAVLTRLAADVANHEEVVMSALTLVKCHNTDAGAQTVTFTSVSDDYGRIKDITAQSIAAGAERIFVFRKPGWAGAGGKLGFLASSALVFISVIALE